MEDGKDDDEMDAVLSKNPDDAGRRKSKASANKSLITRNLRLAYGETMSEPVPDHLLELLGKIDRKEGER